MRQKQEGYWILSALGYKCHGLHSITGTACERVRPLFVSRGCWSPFTGKCLPLPLPSAPIASSQKWRLSISQEMRWNKYPLPMLLMMSVIAHLLWVVLLRRQGHALTSCSLLLLYTVKMNTHFQSFVPFSHMISTTLNSNIVLKEKWNMLNEILIYNNFIHRLFDFHVLILFGWNVWHQKILFKCKISHCQSASQLCCIWHTLSARLVLGQTCSVYVH